MDGIVPSSPEGLRVIRGPLAHFGPTTLTPAPTTSSSFFVTSYHHIKELFGSEQGFGGDLRYNQCSHRLEGADAICQASARRVGFDDKTWRAYLSTSQVDAITRTGHDPWYGAGAVGARSLILAG